MKRALTYIISICLIATTLMFSSCNSQKSLVVLGDSIAEGVGASDKDKSYANILAKELDFSLENFAKSGDTTADLIKKLKTDDVKNAIKNADYVEISIGGNDFLSQREKLLELYNNRSILSLASEISDISKSVEKNMNTIIDMINKINPDVQIVVQTLYTIDIYKLKSTLELFIDGYNEIYYNLAEKYDNVTVSDVRTAFKNSDKNCIADDEVHPSDYGHKLIAQTLKKTFDKLENTNDK